MENGSDFKRRAELRLVSFLMWVTARPSKEGVKVVGIINRPLGFSFEN